MARNRNTEKIKEIRRNFSKTVVSGTRFGNGRIVYEHYDQLVDIWRGSANTEPLKSGVDGDYFNENNNYKTYQQEPPSRSNNENDDNPDFRETQTGVDPSQILPLIFFSVTGYNSSSSGLTYS